MWMKPRRRQLHGRFFENSDFRTWSPGLGFHSCENPLWLRAQSRSWVCVWRLLWISVLTPKFEVILGLLLVWVSGNLGFVLGVLTLLYWQSRGSDLSCFLQVTDLACWCCEKIKTGRWVMWILIFKHEVLILGFHSCEDLPFSSLICKHLDPRGTRSLQKWGKGRNQ